MIKLNRFYLIIFSTIFALYQFVFSVQKQYLKSNEILFLILNSICGFLMTHYIIIPKLIPINIQAGLYGHDIYQKGTENFKIKIAECLGLGISVAYFGMQLFSYFIFKQLNWFDPEVFNFSLGYICFGTFLGFVDDVLNLRWRHKLIYPFLFSLLLIANYQGDSKLHFPTFIENILGFQSIELGFLFYLYMVLLSIFCINSINIYAGISGLETGQSLIIALSLIIENIFCIWENNDQQTNYKSILILLPFVSTTFSLFIFNKVQKKTFVGDTFCYFAGCVIASSGIIGKYPVKLLFFFVPQLINFLLSILQITGIKYCPRHRLPLRDPKTNNLITQFPEQQNLVNFWLYLFGEMNEQQLGDQLLNFQIICQTIVIIFFRIFRFSFQLNLRKLLKQNLTIKNSLRILILYQYQNQKKVKS